MNLRYRFVSCLAGGLLAFSLLHSAAFAQGLSVTVRETPAPGVMEINVGTAAPVVVPLGGNAAAAANRALADLLTSNPGAARQIATALVSATNAPQARGATLEALAALTSAAVSANGAERGTQAIVGALAAAPALAQDDAFLVAGLSTVTAAAVKAASGQAAEVARAAANALLDGRVSGAITAAKASNPAASAGDLQQAGNAAANSGAVTAGVSAIAVAATSNALGASGSTGPEALQLAQTISNAVNGGTAVASQQGSVTTPQVTVAVNTSGVTTRVLATTVSTSGSVSATGLVTGRQVTPVVVERLVVRAEAGTATPAETIIPALDATQPIVSPSSR